jgi:hypothetical protein
VTRLAARRAGRSVLAGDFHQRRAGDSPRFGSAHLRLAAHTLPRATFCYPDSALEPRHFGVAPRLSTLIALAQAAHAPLEKPGPASPGPVIMGRFAPPPDG